MKRSRDYQGHGSHSRHGKYQKYRGREEPDREFKKRRHDEFDLLSRENESKIFKVVFDYYTPRSHFVILPKDGVQLEGRDYSELKDSIREELVKEATNLISEHKLKGTLILSIHRGSWITTKNKFHAHICSEVDEFIRVFYQKEKEIPNWPSESYVTRQWKASRNPIDYEKNVRGYPFKTYFRDEVKSIEEMIKKKEKAKETRTTPRTYEGYTLLYHTSEPRVAFVLEKKPEDKKDMGYVQALDVMNDFARENGMTNIDENGDDKGCHLCLVLGESYHGFEIGQSQTLCGYIQTSGSKFYDGLCPADAREKWFEEFSGHKDYKVYT